MMKYSFLPYNKSEILHGHLNLGGQNCRGDSIDVNSLYFERNGKPWLPVMGEYHFCRADRSEWYRELCKMKSGGITIVSTYLFWNYHEEREGVFDFSGDRDIRAFILTAQRAGLEVVLRIGPWVHGEARYGGFPDWITKKPYQARTTQPEYLSKVRILYTRYYEQITGLFFRDGGPIIGIQLENEISDIDYVTALKNMAEEIGYEVPLWTATGWNGPSGSRLPVREVLAIFGGYPEAPWDDRTGKLPPSVHYAFNKERNDNLIGADLAKVTDETGWRLPTEVYPFATCELGTGNQITHHRRPTITAQDVYALSLVKLGSGNNLIGYYMFHGGTNNIGLDSTLEESRAAGYPNDYTALSYDFQAALSEYGEVREQYRLLNLLHLFVKDFGEILAPMESVMSEHPVNASDEKGLRYAMRTDGIGGFIFVNQYQREMPVADIPDVEFTAGTVSFPPITVRDGMSFIMPFGLSLKDGKNAVQLSYATAQLICCEEDTSTYFFAVIPGITAEFRFAVGFGFTASDDSITVQKVAGCQIVILPMEDARFMRRLDGRIVVGDSCDLFADDDGIHSCTDGPFSYRIWAEDHFEPVFVSLEKPVNADLQLTSCDEPFVPPYPYELHIGGQRKLTWKRIHVSSASGFVEITEDYDCAQIYADGQLIADSFWYPRVWRIPARLLYNRICYLVFSERRNDFFFIDQ
ncbi:MAG: beta-galactosidase [Clostridia bacterium]|nr:beta-galactosidase [Clostridia bacterium]